MKKTGLIIIFCLIFSMLVSCGISDAKNDIAKGDAALKKCDYETALGFYQSAVAEGTSSKRAKALSEILDAYLSAEKAYSKQKYKQADLILSSLEYDYNSYSPINEDMADLCSKVSKKMGESDSIDKLINDLSLQIDDNDFDSAYDTIADIEQYTLNDDQSYDLEHEILRLESKEKKANKSEKKEFDDYDPYIYEESEKPEEKNDEKQNSSSDTPTDSEYYRVRKSWSDSKSQLGAFKNYDGAEKIASENPGYKVYDDYGNQLYP